MNNNLELATTDLYKIFSKYPYNPEMEACPCCVSAEDKCKLVANPLRLLTEEELSEFAWKTMTTWGEVEDYKHFLPRILELASTPGSNLDEFIVIRKLDYAKWKEWDQQEPDAIENFLLSWCSYSLNNSKYFQSCVITEIYKLIPNAKLLFEKWKPQSNKKSLNNLALLIADEWTFILKGRGLVKNWKIEDQQFIISWVLEKKELLENSFFEYENSDNELSTRISNALFLIEHITWYK